MIVVAGMALQDGLVLLGRRKAMGKRGGLWEMPGGKMEEGEGAYEALSREWREELGVDITVGAFVASAGLNLEVRFNVDLYNVMPAPNKSLQMLDHDELKWTNLLFAVEYLPCSPALYLHYRHIVSWMKDVRTLEEQLHDLSTTYSTLVSQGHSLRASAVSQAISDIRSRMK